MPFLLNLIGITFAAPSSSSQAIDRLDLAPDAAPDVLYRLFAGSFIHTLLEWSAVCVAIFTVVLAFAYFRIHRDITTPIIGITLLCAGLMDIFHILASDRLIAAASEDLIPITWILCRVGHASLTTIGVGFVLIYPPQKAQRHLVLMLGIGALFGCITYSLIHFYAANSTLPQVIFPGAIVARPWDIVPLIIYGIAGLSIYPRFYQKYPSLFAHALVLSILPNIVVQFHMALFSTALYDNDFNIAHFQKIVAYAVPLLGLILDYIHTHDRLQQVNRSLANEIKERQQTEKNLQDSETREREKSYQLEQTLQTLQKAQAQLVQSEKMLSLSQLVAGIAHEINNPVNFIHGNVQYAQQYTQDLLDLLRLYQQQGSTDVIRDKAEAIDLDFLQEDFPKLLTSMRVGSERIREIVQSLRTFSRLDEADLKQVDIHEGIDSALLLLHSRLKANSDHPEIQVIKQYGKLPLVECYAGQLNQVIMNILMNAIDTLDERHTKLSSIPTPLPPTITIQTTLINPETIRISIADNGLGMTPEIQRQIFDPFFTTKLVGKGTGMGLSISYQVVVDKHQGVLNCHSIPNQGSDFWIDIPVRQ